MTPNAHASNQKHHTQLRATKNILLIHAVATGPGKNPGRGDALARSILQIHHKTAKIPTNWFGALLFCFVSDGRWLAEKIMTVGRARQAKKFLAGKK